MGDVNLSVTLAGVTLKNPVIPASGTFGYGREAAELYDLNVLGAFAWKGTTALPRDGNPPPRIAETPGGMLNAIGLQNPGIDAVIKEEVPNIARIFPCALPASTTFPISRVPFWTSRVAKTPFDRSTLASITVPKTRPFGFASIFIESAVSRTASIRSSIP